MSFFQDADMSVCPGNGWSVITSAATNSQLAGVLAGFVFTGAVMLAGRSAVRDARAIGLFFAAFVVLGFDSYLFSLVSGEVNDSLCRRAWAEAMPASGMLAVGGLAVVSGLGHLVSDRRPGLDASSSGVDYTSNENLQKFTGHAIRGVATAVTLLLAVTALDYADAVLGRRPSALVFTVMLLAICVVAFIYLPRLRGPQDPPPDSAVPAGTVSGLLAYGIAGPVYAGALTNLPQSYWANGHLVQVSGSAAFGLVVPLLLVVALVNTWRTAHGKFRPDWLSFKYVWSRALSMRTVWRHD